MVRFSAVAIFVALATPGSAATLLVETISFLSGVGSEGPVGGTDGQGLVTNTALGDASAQFNSSVSMPGGTTSGYASGDVATGELRASISTNPGIYYQGVEGVSVYGAEGGGFSQVLVSETFVASGSGNVRFDLAYDGFWDISPQQYTTVLGNGLFDPNWSVSASIALSDGSFFSGDSFYTDHSIGQGVGSVFGVLSVFGSLLDGVEYGISLALNTAISTGAVGGIDFANTAVLSFSADPGVSLRFSDSRFLSSGSSTPSPIPLPASGLLLAAPLLLLFTRKALSSMKISSLPTPRKA